METRVFPSWNPFSLWVPLEIGLHCLRQGPGRPAGSLCHHTPAFPPPRSLPLAWLCEGSVTLNSGRFSSGGSLGTAGKAQAAAPAQFSLTASKALPAWLSAQHRLREGERGGDGRAHRAWGPRNTTRDLQRAAPSRKRVLRTASPGSPDCPKQSPPL